MATSYRGRPPSLERDRAYCLPWVCRSVQGVRQGHGLPLNPPRPGAPRPSAQSDGCHQVNSR